MPSNRDSVKVMMVVVMVLRNGIECRSKGPRKQYAF